jgi:hypothetical protein
MGFVLLGLGNEVLKNGIEVMQVDSQFLYVLSIFKKKIWSVFGVFGHDFCC